MNDTVIENQIAELYCARPYGGVAPVEEAIQAALAYRRQLSDTDCTEYDAMIMEGRHPGAAAELVELMSGRLQQLTGREVKLSEPDSSCI